MDHKATIKEAMKATNTTQSQLGTMLGINQQAVSNYLSRDDIKLSTYTKIMDALGYDLILKKRSE